MGWVDALKGSLVYVDTAPFIYFTEKHPTYLKMVYPFFEAMDRNQVKVVTSTVTVLEVLVNPIKQKDTKTIRMYRSLFFNTRGLRTIDVSQQIAQEAARLRAFYPKLETPDAIHMATAIYMNITYFLTNDSRLPSIPELKIIVLDELKTRPEYLTPDDLH